jgi:catechol 2,3-dioxygenase-like lactoylglutathione lyase family enzyme
MTSFEDQTSAKDEDQNRSGVSRIDRMGLSVANWEAARTFYTEVLGFRTVGLERREGEAFTELTGIDDARARARARARAAIMRLGEQTVELVQFEKPGRAYPEPRAANDPWFQHFAIAVSDMDAAFARLSRFGAEPVSQGGPQRLPPSTGDVTAYKFRDPDGHPLELSYAPKSPWAHPGRRPADQPTLGVDHSGLAVADLDASIHFYTRGLGLRLGPSALNQGPEQARLDGLDDPVVDIATLTTAQRGPHLELLSYRTPKSLAPPRVFSVNDIAATRLVMQTDDLDQTTERALAAGATQLSKRIVNTPTGRRVLLRDPDGHALELVGQTD